MTHLARRVAAACHQDRVDGLAAEFAFFGVLSLHRDREPGRQVASPG